MSKDSMDQEFMSIIAYLYYYADMNQSDIADRLFLSRSTVSRLIKKARQNGVVELKINEPWERDLPLEDEVKTTFSIDSVRVIKVPTDANGETVLNLLSQITAFYISCNAKKHSIVGISWGNTIDHVCNAITTIQNISMTIVPIMGTMTYPKTNPESAKLSQRFAKMYGGRFFPLEAPLYASSQEELVRMQRDPSISDVIDTARNADLIISSVGSIEDRSWEHILGIERLLKLKEIGCIGHIGGHFYDISGSEISGAYKELHIGLTLDEIKANSNVICVAGTPKKAEAVFGALRGHMINTLITTYPLAQELLEVARRRSL